LESKNLARRANDESHAVSDTARGEDKVTVRHLCDDLDHFYVTDAAERFARVAERFLGVAPRVLEAVEVWGQDSLKA